MPFPVLRSRREPSAWQRNGDRHRTNSSVIFSWRRPALSWWTGPVLAKQRGHTTLGYLCSTLWRN
ncbi:unnamed protein product [Staurois parvus]|uniref:Uncharacterized protein n=1 Tax=Staurois parvus TaxID=386267 RepID=A0ABN9HH85_9NEOB|nr:unnamed protein product [Staurois parvus]